MTEAEMKQRKVGEMAERKARRVGGTTANMTPKQPPQPTPPPPKKKNKIMFLGYLSQKRTSKAPAPQVYKTISMATAAGVN